MLCLIGVFFKPVIQYIIYDALNNRAHFGGNQLIFSLAGEFGIGHFNRQNSRQTFTAIITGQRHFFFFSNAAGIGIIVDSPSQCPSKTSQMRAAISLRNIIGETKHRLVIAVIPPQCDFYRDAILVRGNQYRALKQGLLRAVKITSKGLKPAFIKQCGLFFFCPTLIAKINCYAAIEER